MKNKPTYKNIPEFAVAGTKDAPGSSTQSNGYVPGNKFPANEENYFMNALTGDTNKVVDSLNNVMDELNNALATKGISPNATASQIATMLSYFVSGNDASSGTDISGSDLNSIGKSGFYHGIGMTNTPNGSAGWFHVINIGHNGGGTDWQRQIAFGYGTGGSSDTWIHSRQNVSGVGWTPWNPIWTSVNDGSGSGLDADLLDGVHKPLGFGVNHDGGSTIITSGDVKDHLSVTGSSGWFYGSITNQPASGSYWYITCLASGDVSNRGMFLASGGNGPELWVGNLGPGGIIDWNKLYGKDNSQEIVSSIEDLNSGDFLTYLDSVDRRSGRGLVNVACTGMPTANYFLVDWFKIDVNSIWCVAKEIGTNGNSWVITKSVTWGSWRKMWDAGNDGSGSGLDADLLDGKDSNRFIFGDADNTGGITWSHQDLNDITKSGFYRGDSLGNAPEGSSEWFHVQHMAHSDAVSWSRQIAYGFGTTTGGENKIYTRQKIAATWTNWNPILTGNNDYVLSPQVANYNITGNTDITVGASITKKGQSQRFKFRLNRGSGAPYAIGLYTPNVSGLTFEVDFTEWYFDNAGVLSTSAAFPVNVFYPSQGQNSRFEYFSMFLGEKYFIEGTIRAY